MANKNIYFLSQPWVLNKIIAENLKIGNRDMKHVAMRCFLWIAVWFTQICVFFTHESFVSIAYEPLKLMQGVVGKTNEICLRYLDNSMLYSLPPPGEPHNVVTVFASKNRRKKMEDRHVVINDLNTIFNRQVWFFYFFGGFSVHQTFFRKLVRPVIMQYLMGTQVMTLLLTVRLIYTNF